MNEIRNIIILYEKKNMRKLKRLIKQVNNLNISKILIISKYDLNIETNNNIVVNNSYNINEIINGPYVVFNSNNVLENDLVKYVVGSDFEGKNILFTKDDTNVKSNEIGLVTDITNNDINKFIGIIRIKDYKLTDNIENILNSNINFYEASINQFYFNNKINPNIDRKKTFKHIDLISIDKLKRIENYDKSRANKLKNKIICDGHWKVPIIVEKNDYMILDGHHRFEVAKELGLNKIPAILVNYNDIDVWSLRKEINISQKIVREYVINKNLIYPYKTVKHKCPFNIPEINIEIRRLI